MTKEWRGFTMYLIFITDRQAVVYVLKRCVFNKQLSFILPIMWCPARSRALKCYIPELRIRLAVNQTAVSFINCHVIVPFLLSTVIFAFMTGTAENPVCHKYVSTQESETFTVVCDNLDRRFFPL